MRTREQKHKALFDAACDVADDFERYGGVLQADENEEYGKTTSIFKLQRAIADVLDRNRE